MNLHTLPLRDAVEEVDALLRQLLLHPQTSQQDKASVILTRNQLMEITRRHMPRVSPVNPATLPPRKSGQGYPRLPKGWAMDWEEQKEAANA